MKDASSEELHLAIDAVDVAAVRRLLDSGASPAAADWSGVSALARASQRGASEIVALLLQRGATLDRKEKNGGLAIFGALRHGADTRILDMLLAAGGDLEVRVHGRTTLMEAAARGSLPLVERILASGVDPAARDRDGATALDAAVRGKHSAVARRLRALGAGEQFAPRRALVAALRKAFGGKATECSGGTWLLNPTKLGARAQFTISPEGWRLVVSSIAFRSAALRGPSPAILRVRHRDGDSAIEPRELPGARVRDEAAPEEAKLAVPPARASWRATCRADAPARMREALRAECGAARPFLDELKLEPGDELVIWADETLLQLRGHDPAAAIASADVLRRLLAILAPAGRREEPARRPRFALVRGARIREGLTSSGPAHRWGGAPDAAVACRNCAAPLPRVLRLDLRDERLGGVLEGATELEVLCPCQECGSGPWFFDHSGPVARAFGEDPIEPGEEEPADVLDSCSELKLVPSKPDARPANALGGRPRWIQSGETPRCPRCEAEMAWLLEVRSIGTTAFGDDGRLYVFTCASCRVSASLVQSH